MGKMKEIAIDVENFIAEMEQKHNIKLEVREKRDSGLSKEEQLKKEINRFLHSDSMVEFYPAISMVLSATLKILRFSKDVQKDFERF